MREFTIGDMHVKFDDSAPEPEDQRETTQPAKPIRRAVGALVPRVTTERD